MVVRVAPLRDGVGGRSECGGGCGERRERLNDDVRNVEQAVRFPVGIAVELELRHVVGGGEIGEGDGGRGVLAVDAAGRDEADSLRVGRTGANVSADVEILGKADGDGASWGDCTYRSGDAGKRTKFRTHDGGDGDAAAGCDVVARPGLFRRGNDVHAHVGKALRNRECNGFRRGSIEAGIAGVAGADGVTADGGCG